MDIFRIIQDLATNETCINQKTIRGLQDILGFFCFGLGNILKISDKLTHLPFVYTTFESPSGPPEVFFTFYNAQHGVVRKEISGRAIVTLPCKYCMCLLYILVTFRNQLPPLECLIER